MRRGEKNLPGRNFPADASIWALWRTLLHVDTLLSATLRAFAELQYGEYANAIVGIETLLSHHQATELMPAVADEAAPTVLL